MVHCGKAKLDRSLARGNANALLQRSGDVIGIGQRRNTIRAGNAEKDTVIDSDFARGPFVCHDSG